MKKGQLIAIEGTDGSGKTTQINLLQKYCKDKGIDFEVVSFPQYGKNEFAEFIYNYLSGKFGGISGVEVHELAKKYADDRKTVKDLIAGWLEDGKLVIANRYVSSSKAHLSAHLPEDKREEFINFIDHLEYEENQMPREDLTILLNVDPKIGQENVLKRPHTDIHEENLTHLKEAGKIFVELAEENNWEVIDCMKDGEMRIPEEIQSEIVQIIDKNLQP